MCLGGREIKKKKRWRRERGEESRFYERIKESVRVPETEKERERANEKVNGG